VRLPWACGGAIRVVIAPALPDARRLIVPAAVSAERRGRGGAARCEPASEGAAPPPDRGPRARAEVRAQRRLRSSELEGRTTRYESLSESPSDSDSPSESPVTQARIVTRTTFPQLSDAPALRGRGSVRCAGGARCKVVNTIYNCKIQQTINRKLSTARTGLRLPMVRCCASPGMAMAASDECPRDGRRRRPFSTVVRVGGCQCGPGRTQTGP
jgi:hypothetical protein